MELTTQETSSQLRGDMQKLLLAKGEIGLKDRRPSECARVRFISVSYRSTGPSGVTASHSASLGPHTWSSGCKSVRGPSTTLKWRGCQSLGPRSTSGPRGLHQHHTVHIRSTHPGGVLACCGTRCLHGYRPGSRGDLIETHHPDPSCRSVMCI